MSGEAYVACKTRCCIAGSDSCALPGQVANLIVVGCSTTSSADCHSVAAGVLLASSIPVVWFGLVWFGESVGLVVFVIGVDVMDVLKASPVPKYWAEEYYRHAVIIGHSGIVFATALWQ